MFTRIHSNRLVYWALLIIIVLFIPAGATAADPPLSPELPLEVNPDESVSENPIPMTFQPSEDAESLEAFFPPQTNIETVFIPAGVIESSEPPQTGAPATIWQTQISPQQNIVVDVNNGQLGVIMEEGTFTQPVTLTIHSLNQSIMTPGVGNGVVGPMVEFALEVYANSNQVMGSFDKQVRLVVDLRDYGIDLDDVGGYFYLAYEDTLNPGQWLEVPVTYYGRTGLLGAEVGHFSNWQSGWRPEAWALEWKPPTVNEFTGSASYQYPLQVPPGRNGLQPSVGLAYSSASLRGAIRQVSHGTVATGWSLSDISITRTGIKNETTYWNYPDTFRLAVNGIGGRLIPTGSEGNAAVYRVEDTPQFKVYNYGGRTWEEDQTGNSYWVVRGADGAQYRLGYTADSVSRQGVRGIDAPSYDYEIIAWHVDTITDAFGNQVNYDYIQPGRHEDYGFWCPWGGVCGWEVDTYNSQIETISYNFNTRVATPPAHDVARLVDQANTNPASRITFVYDDLEARLAAIYVFHGSGTDPIRKYVIHAQTANYVHPNPKCDEYHANGAHTPLSTSTRVINDIEEQGFDAIANEWVALPKTQFTYTLKPHFTHLGDAECFQYQYLTEVENGYGGSVEFTYFSDGRIKGDYENCKGVASCNPESYPHMGYNYSVASVLTRDGRNNAVATTYAYSGLCYDQNFSTCKQPETDTADGVIGGYREVTATTANYNGAPLRRQITRYHLDLNRYGHVEHQETGKFDAAFNYILLQATDTTYHVDFFAASVRFTYAANDN